jgi:Fungal N-terminal domain of STAND proteins
MTDPLSVAASIAGLVSLASDLAQTCYSCYQFYRTVKDAPKSLQQVIEEIGLLRKVLSDLEDVYRKKTEDLPSLENVIEKIAKCRVEIEDFGQKLALGSQDFRKAVVRLKWPSREQKVKQFISHLQVYRAMFDSAKSNDGLLLAMQNLTVAKETHQDLQSEKSRRQLEELLNWLSPLDFQQRQDDIYYKRRQDRTGTWILREPKFKQWRDTTRNSSQITLFCKGDPGAGKTVLWYLCSKLTCLLCNLLIDLHVAQ